MQKTFSLIGLVIILTTSFQLKAQYTDQDSTYKKHFIGSSMFMLVNLAPGENPPDFVQLNFGYRLSPKDVVSLELKTWKYAWPLGIPFGKNYEAPELKFPGFIRDYGFALAYHRFLWKGLYAGIHVMPAWQNFINDNGEKIDKGFQIFNTYRLGYHIKLFKDRFFIQPGIAVTHRIYHTDMPDSFKQIDDNWSKFFVGEPGFHFGFNF